MNKIIFGIIIVSTFISCRTASDKNVSYQIDVDTVYHSPDTLFLQARSVVFPDKKTAMITMNIYGIGNHAYGNIYCLYSSDHGETWSKPLLIENLRRRAVNDTLLRVFGDITPDWHSKSRTVLCTGKSFFSYLTDTANVYSTKQIDIGSLQEAAYAVYNPSENSWSKLEAIDFPEKPDDGDLFRQVNSGCSQRFDLPDGNILLPVRYSKDKTSVVTVALCAFDGKKITYLKHGSTFAVPEKRGVGEASICYFNGEYFLTMRHDLSGYVAKSKDGLNYGPLKKWMFSDGTWLGSYNTQQHWISHPRGLFLVYTRKGANNDHIFRHRAPLFIAQVNTDSLYVLRETERILIPTPEDSGDFGNFGVTHINENETWVTVSVSPKADNVNRTCNILIAKIKWR